MTGEVPVTAWIAGSFRQLSTEDLLLEWGQNLPPGTRQLLLAELESRGVDEESLPRIGAPDSDPTGSSTPAADARRRTFRLCTWTMLAVAALSFATGLEKSVSRARNLDRFLEHLAEGADLGRVTFEGRRMRLSKVREELEARQNTPLKIGAGLAGVFLALALWARAMPRTAVALALAVHVAFTKDELVLYESLRVRQLVLPTLVAVALAYLLARFWSMPAAEAVKREEAYWSG